MKAKWKLREVLEEEGVSVSRLAAEMAATSRSTAPAKRPALYSITSKDESKRPTRVSFDLLSEIGGALRRLTGRKVEVGELVVFEESE